MLVYSLHWIAKRPPASVHQYELLSSIISAA